MQDELLTTTQAAAIIGCSRQHVVDLCTSGTLAWTTTGTHRRLVRGDVERFAQRSGRPRLEQTRSLWIGRATAAAIARDPEAAIAIARTNLQRLRALHPRSGPWLDRWDLLLRDPEAAMATLTAPTSDAAELRQNSPFAGVLPAAELEAVVESCRRWWVGNR